MALLILKAFYSHLLISPGLHSVQVQGLMTGEASKKYLKICRGPSSIAKYHWLLLLG
jgi:hypothetical protein